MILGFITLAIAVTISIVSAYYSILGLTSIFAAAFWPIVIMGGALEAGKVITAVWLHANWKRAELQYKLYLVPAVIFLMFLTSIGVFGFLSKSHSDQALVSGDVQAQLMIYDEKIRMSRDIIDTDHKALAQMDAAVDQLMARSTDERGAERAVNLRRTQATERGRMLKEIEQEQKKITALNEESIPIRAQARKADADVGPIKYVAAMIYGANASTETLEAAVRWVIVLIVSVFDPLAIMLIIAGIKQLEWTQYFQMKSGSTGHYSRSGEDTDIDEHVNAYTFDNFERPTIDELIDDITPENTHDEQLVDTTPAPTVEPVPTEDHRLTELQTQLATRDAELKDVLEALVTLNDQQDAVNSANLAAQAREQALQAQIKELERKLENNLSNQVTDAVNRARQFTQLEPPAQEPESVGFAEYQPDDGPITPDQLAQIQTVAPVPVEPVVITRIIAPESNPEVIVTPVTIEDRPGDYVKITDVTPVREPNLGFGDQFPNTPERGDMCMRTDFKPSRLFKWNDVRWLEINKNSVTVYNYNDAYIQHLVEKLSTGEYTADDITEVELAQVQKTLGGRGV